HNHNNGSNNMGNSQNRSANTDEKSPPGGASLVRMGIGEGGVGVAVGGVGGAPGERRNSRVRVLSHDVVSLDYTDSLEYHNCSSDDCCYASNDTLTQHRNQELQQRQRQHHHLHLHHHQQQNHTHQNNRHYAYDRKSLCTNPVDEVIIPRQYLHATKIDAKSKRDRPLSEISVTSVDTLSPNTAKAVLELQKRCRADKLACLSLTQEVEEADQAILLNTELLVAPNSPAESSPDEELMALQLGKKLAQVLGSGTGPLTPGNMENGPAGSAPRVDSPLGNGELFNSSAGNNSSNPPILPTGDETTLLATPNSASLPSEFAGGVAGGAGGAGGVVGGTGASRRGSSYVPEKLSFAAYEKFEGQMLMKWLISTMQSNPKSFANDITQELFSSLALQFCNNLKYVGVLKQISNEHLDGGFSPYEMYQWTHTEQPTTSLPLTPGKLDKNAAWPFTSTPSGTRVLESASLASLGAGAVGKTLQQILKKRLLNCSTLAEVHAVVNELLSSVDEPPRRPSKRCVNLTDLLNASEQTVYEYNKSGVEGGSKSSVDAETQTAECEGESQCSSPTSSSSAARPCALCPAPSAAAATTAARLCNFRSATSSSATAPSELWRTTTAATPSTQRTENSGSSPDEPPVAAGGEAPPPAPPTKEIWTEIEETPLDNIDEFTELFSRQAMAPVSKPKELKVKRAKSIKVLDPERSRNHMSNIRATEDELQRIKEAAGGDIPLDHPEQFLLDISLISMASERISCIVFQAEFEESVTLLMRKLETLAQLSQQLIESEDLKLRGQADGFNLDILGKLKDVKSKESHTTLLHFIVRTYIAHRRKEGVHPLEIRLPIPEPADVERAAQMDFEEVQQQIFDLNKKFLGCKRTTAKVLNASRPEILEPFKSKMEEFMEGADKSMAKLHQSLEECRELFLETMRFYHFSPKACTLTLAQCTPDQFFEMKKSKQAQIESRRNVSTKVEKSGRISLKERMLLRRSKN
ncbi:hypothetical protein M5D96_003799, partial [Drosophila gunungcola]